MRLIRWFKHRSPKTGMVYKIEVWKGMYSFCANVLPMGSSEPIYTVRAEGKQRASGLAKRWVDLNR